MTEQNSSERVHEPWDTSAAIAGLRDAREKWRTRHDRHAEYGTQGFPSRRSLDRIVGLLAAALFPLRLGPPEVTLAAEDRFVEATLETALSQLAAQIRLELNYSLADKSSPATDVAVENIVTQFAARLPALRELLDTDVEAAYDGDPAARSVDEVLLCYPCLIAVIHHRLAHELFQLGAPLVARIIAEIAHSRTGIDIHPGATIGRGFFIDHGTGVVIGETAIIGNNVRLYQAVTLGAKSFATDAHGAILADPARHPIIEDDVVIYAGATVLGRVTIGKGAVLGGNVWVTKDVPAYTTLTIASSRAETRSPGAEPHIEEWRVAPSI
ncbi:serine O-acetyltransferase EpsC [Sphingomonas tabacisoli]|uniref:serine O-acetyltransferase n=1 Tax=Sphingomonas tabacisoli TaxID=2249466 RepID=A0ABW4I066_9SPHN